MVRNSGTLKTLVNFSLLQDVATKIGENPGKKISILFCLFRRVSCCYRPVEKNSRNVIGSSRDFL